LFSTKPPETRPNSPADHHCKEQHLMITKVIETAIGVVIVGVVLAIIAVRAISGWWSSCDHEPATSPPVGGVTVEVGQ